MKVLMILNHAPDYREAFLRELGKYKSIDLTVIAQPCEPYGLTPPDHREGYQYIEINSVRFFGLLWQPGLGRILRGDHWDVVCASANFRHLAGLFLFMTNPGYQQRWVWWGHIYGRSSFKLLTYTRKWFLGKAAVILVHSKSVAVRLIKDYGFTAVSFNNTEIMKREFRAAHFNKDNREIRLLFVGRYSPRKKLDYLVQLANRRQEIKVRFVGPGMETLKIPIELITRGLGCLNPPFFFDHFLGSQFHFSPSSQQPMSI